MITKKGSFPITTRFYSVILALLPILAITKYNIAGIYLDRLCLVVFSMVTVLILLNRQKILVNAKTSIVLFGYCVVVTFNAFFYGSCGAFGIICVWLIVFLGLSNTVSLLADYNLIRKTVIMVSLIAAAAVIIQTVLYYTLGVYWSPLPRSIYNPAIMESYSTFLKSSVDLANGLFRPCGIFFEPAHMAEYCIVGLILSLFDKDRSKNYVSIIITIGIVLTTSGIGIALVSCVWAYRIISSRREKGAHFSGRTLVLILIAVVGVYIALSRMGILNILKYRFTFGSTGTGFSSRFSDVELAFNDFGTKEFLFGVGFDRPNSFWLSGLFSVAWQIGILGLFLQLFIIFGYFIRAAKLEKCIILVYFGLMLTAEVSNMTHMTFYLGVVIASMIHRQRESEDLYEVANSQ